MPDVIYIGAITDEQVYSIAKHRKHGRIPTLTYLHRKSGCSIWRSSEPFPSLVTQGSSDDKYNINLMASGGNLHIFTARSDTQLGTSNSRGYGFENPNIYKGIVRHTFS